MKIRFFAVCLSLAGLILASPNVLAQNFGDFLLGGGWSVQPPAHPAPSLPPEKAGDYKPLAENLKKQLPEGADLRDSASGFRNLGDFVSAVHASNNLQIPFKEVKARMVNGGSLGSAIAALRPEIDSQVEARRARAAAQEALRHI
jgi:hypothetical protein